MKLSSAFFIVLTSFVLGGSATTSGDVKKDMTATADKVNALDKAIMQLPMTGATADQFSAIQHSGQSLAISLHKGTSDVNALNAPLSEADGKEIMNTVQGFAPVVGHSLGMLVQKQPAFAAAGLTGQAKQDLMTLNTYSDSFASALITKAPTPDLKNVALGLKQKLDTDFAKTIAAYT